MSYADYLAQVLAPLVSDPTSVRIVQTEDSIGTLLTLTVAQKDMGIVIGKEGSTSKCLRSLLHLAGVRAGVNVTLKITESDGSPYRPWNREKTEEVLPAS
jgi:predicted RNA-binding protein YlqC (UPF0109 family)